jgi:hypothetical protein
MRGFFVFSKRWQFLLLSIAPALLAACASKPMEPYTTDTPPLVLLPAEQAGIIDQRGRFREIVCTVLEARRDELPQYRNCEEALTRLGAEPPGSGAAVDLGPSKRHLVAAMVPGIGWDCIQQWMVYENEFAAHIGEHGYRSYIFAVDGRSGTDNNARQIRDAFIAHAAELEPASVVLIGYSKGAPDILTAIVDYPEIRPYVAAVVSAAGAVGGSALANNATEGQLELLKHIPDSECSEGDGHAVESLRPAVRRKWLQDNPLPDSIPYYSLVTLPSPDRISSVLRGSYKKLSQIDPRNDSQVIFYDQIIPGSKLLGYLNADHWAIAVPIMESHPFIGKYFVDHNDYPREALAEALMRFIEEDLAKQ